MRAGNLPAQRHQRFAIGLVKLGTIQRLDEIRTQLVGLRQRLIAAETVDLRAAARSINAALSGRGGGASGMIQGSLLASREQIEEYFHGKIG